MTVALTPELALAYLGELSPGITRSAMFGDGDGALAGDVGLSPSGEGDAAAIVVRDGEWGLVVSVGAGTPRALVEFDARLAMAAVRGRC